MKTYTQDLHVLQANVFQLVKEECLKYRANHFSEHFIMLKTPIDSGIHTYNYISYNDNSGEIKMYIYSPASSFNMSKHITFSLELLCQIADNFKTSN